MLCERNILVKTDRIINGVKFCAYSMGTGGAIMRPGWCDNATGGGAIIDTGGGAIMRPNNIYINNLIDNSNKKYTKRVLDEMNKMLAILSEYKFSKNQFEGVNYFRAQFNLLSELSEMDRINSIQNSIARGYKAMVYSNNDKSFTDTCSPPANGFDERKEKGVKF